MSSRRLTHCLPRARVTSEVTVGSIASEKGMHEGGPATPLNSPPTNKHCVVYQSKRRLLRRVGQLDPPTHEYWG